MDELKPCPFCGSDEFLAVAHSVMGSHSFWQVECGCHASGAPEYIRMDAVREWNTRTVAANGYAYVPVEPTFGMVQVGIKVAGTGAVLGAYEAMVREGAIGA